MVTISNKCGNDKTTELMHTIGCKKLDIVQVIKPNIPLDKTCLVHFISLGEGVAQVVGKIEVLFSFPSYFLCDVPTPCMTG